MSARRSFLRAALLLLGPPAWAAPASAPESAFAFPRRLRDALGREVVVARPPQRLVVVFPSNVEIAFALGLEARIAAIGGRVFWPAAARDKASIGGALGYSAEAVAAQRPDLIVVTPSHRTALGLIAPFERIGVPVLVLQHPDLASILRNIGLLGRATGQDAEAAALVAGMQAQLAVVRQRVGDVSRRRVYLETGSAGRGMFQTVGRGHYASDALAWAGGDNVFDDLAGAAQVSGEAIFVRDPDVIIALQREPQPAAAIAARPGWERLRAVREGRVRVLERGHALIPGPRQIEAVLAYARALHPECFDARS